MIVWLNGTHGAGKTTTSALVQQLITDSRVFDAEKVGETLMDITPVLSRTDNFQHWPPWRSLVVETARQVLDYTGGTLVMPMTVLVEPYWREISSGLARHAIPLRHFVLHADQETLRGRIEGDTDMGPPRSASGTWSPTPRRPAPGCTARPRSSTPRTSRPRRRPSRSREPSGAEVGVDRPRAGHVRAGSGQVVAYEGSVDRFADAPGVRHPLATKSTAGSAPLNCGPAVLLTPGRSCSPENQRALANRLNAAWVPGPATPSIAPV